MRPPEFSGGNPQGDRGHRNSSPAFNEAAGILRRGTGATARHGCSPGPRPSMRPPEFSGGNDRTSRLATPVGHGPSMRPPEFSGGNAGADDAVWLVNPPAFNEAAGILRREREHSSGVGRRSRAFNEAAGILRREPRTNLRYSSSGRGPSMRPPEFSGGNRVSTKEARRHLMDLQ